ncbi:hypothetical protein [Niabella sp.]|uniref:hypothetical protein n=1 Tax=Niabella sp. TaxID=1962976 RepID=UPI002607BF5E|nr:hypothetical protein [Niabella sp.]
MMRTVLIFWLLIIFGHYSCVQLKIPEKKYFTLAASKWTNNDIVKTNGYYYRKHQKTGEYWIIILYDDGFCSLIMKPGFNELKQVEAYIYSKKDEFQKKKDDVSWGKYCIQSNKVITIENFNFNPDNGNLAVYRKVGQVLNDTTFRMDSFWVNNEQYRDDKAIYHFKQYNPMPSSRNWIENTGWYKKINGVDNHPIK